MRAGGWYRERESVRARARARETAGEAEDEREVAMAFFQQRLSNTETLQIVN